MKHSPWCLITVPLEIEMANDKLKKHKSPGTDPILAELVKEEDHSLWDHKLVNSMWNKKELIEKWKELINVCGQFQNQPPIRW